MLEFQSVSFRYPQDDYWMMQNLSFTIEDGAFVSIIGSSGCGKSTIFRLIDGLEVPSSGQILWDGVPVDAAHRAGAYMPQKDLLFPWRTVGDNVALPLEIRRMPKKEQQAQVDAMLQKVGLLAYRDRYPRDLSGGMRQRAAFARTLLTGSSLLLLDEPFSALDSLTKISMQQWLLGEWEREKKTILFVTHDVEEAIFLSDRILVVYDRPITHLVAYPIDLPHPRQRSDLKQEAIQNLKERLIQELGGGNRP
ncbi:MAG TPA: ABC transporter ATP-binding protein [Firmicutes bacterium]|nr:ABC transporter ATP-binding protein [Bacillota bacterium]